MIVNIKKLNENAVIPFYSLNGDAGLDLTAISMKYTKNYIEYGTGLAIEIPRNFLGLLFPRSSISNKDLSLTNSVGVIDSNFRGEILLRFKSENKENIYHIGDRIGQLLIIPYPYILLQETKELPPTTRGEAGFGSTGK